MSQTDSQQRPPGIASGNPAARWGQLLSIALLGLIGSSWCPPTLALASDRQQPIHISSNSAERDESKGITTYSGAVEISQGTLQIQANKVVIHSDGNKISRIVATGSPAKYQQVPAENKQLVVAKGETIEYLISDDKLRLISKASLYQSDGTTMTGDKINYDIKASIVTAESGSTSSSDRIHMIIPPKPKDSD
ncbi:MAG: lipopolysaccharide transport periplasmic protein LptA [Gammaproteobacteria bacterium]|uniref:lipopolysaccharide transport periplasmic protein LptA n=1 Tax=Pseudomaricurvus alcaniphilus TaxID=1166482 RepID=UPI001407B662|nr:lipopolysaccharide transport periplasmic protein LptA [Pseudomaricurvus alcaniphilus]MBR9910534.1 lipopolysaccharide transport periplasmic protein LptA [Gammaproteobacteria bacterium]NHN39667.1 lipopolysaccharide transport periplasmic protein LptA [Pseudomaricurvus alcaniphilus]